MPAGASVARWPVTLARRVLFTPNAHQAGCGKQLMTLLLFAQQRIPC